MQKENHVLSVDDLEQALELTDKEDIKDEQRMLEGIVRFGDETAKEIMTSRQDVVDIDFKSSFSEVLKCIVENNYSRIPVLRTIVIISVESCISRTCFLISASLPLSVGSH